MSCLKEHRSMNSQVTTLLGTLTITLGPRFPKYIVLGMPVPKVVYPKKGTNTFKKHSIPYSYIKITKI